MSKLGWFGVIATILYILAFACIQFEKLQDLHVLGLNEFGDFLAGALGPIGIFWLVLGFFQQGAELRNSINALDLQTQELRQSVEQQRELASATNKQLDLQYRQFARTTQELTKSRTPKFIVTYLGIVDREDQNSYEAHSGPLRHKLAFANVGGTACEVELFLGYGALEPDEDTIVVWQQFEIKYRYVELFASDTHGDTIQLDIKYKDAEGNSEIAEFSFVRVTHGARPRFEIH